MSFSFKANGLITLTSDFGLADPYVGVMKAAVLMRNPHAQLLDLTHAIPSFQMQIAGFWLARCWPYFPVGTVHLAVVDPGVGTPRSMVLLENSGQLFVAPDNGLLDAVAKDCPQAIWRQFDWQDLIHLHLPTPSQTFHGRDIFAPLVAEITAGRQSPATLGRVVERVFDAGDASNQGQIVCADHYGNLLTDIPEQRLSQFQQPALLFREQHIVLHNSYGFAPTGELLAVVNSWGTLEISVASGSAQQQLQAIPGEWVRVVEGSKG